MAAEKKFSSISVSDTTFDKINTIRKRLMDDWKKEHGVDMTLSIAGTIDLMTAYYESRQTAGMTKGFDAKVKPEVSA